MSRPTQLGTVAGLTGLVGTLPLLFTLGIAQLVPSFGAIVLTIFHVALTVIGAWIFAIWFGD